MMPGIHAMLFALFDEHERLDRTAMRRQVEHCIAAGVDGIAALGLAGEVGKLSFEERAMLMGWVAEDVGGRLPVTFTIYANSVAEQLALVGHAQQSGAASVILQPPMAGAYSGGEYIDFFGRIAAATRIPVAIQNAPAYMGRGLSAEEIERLTTRHPNISLIKGEAPATEIQSLIALTAGRLPVFNGRGGLELVDNLRAGCAGLILAPDIVDHAVDIHRLFRAGDEAGADAAYAAILPAIVFAMQSIESLIAYGKRVFAARTGLTIHDRAPALRPTPFGLGLVSLHARRLGRFPGA